MRGEHLRASAGGHQRIVADAAKEKRNREGEERPCTGAAEVPTVGYRRRRRIGLRNCISAAAALAASGAGNS